MEELNIQVVTDRTIGDLIELQSKQILRVNPEYQRGLRWSELQKRMFLDSVFRGYSIPAFYFHKRSIVVGTDIQNVHFDIVDGQQRINAISSYSEGAFALQDPESDTGFRFPNFVKDVPCPWGGKRYDELSEELKEALKDQPVVIYEITTENDNYIRDLFIRLQGGTPLTPQDKRDSWPGNFTEFVLRVGGKSNVDRWYGLPLFQEVAKVTNESRRRQLTAQVYMLFSTVRREKRFRDIRSADIDEFYHAHVDFDERSPDARRFEKVCEILHAALQGRPRIVGHYIIHLALLVDSLLDEYVSGWETSLASKLHAFEARRKEGAESVRNQSESDFEEYYYRYGQMTQTRTDAAHTIKRRHSFFVEEMLSLLAPVKRDSVRGFSELERATIFFRDDEMCQWCRMNAKGHRVDWNECEVHHVAPHSEGGQTLIHNGALVHQGCHPKRSEEVTMFREWWPGKEVASTTGT